MVFSLKLIRQYLFEIFAHCCNCCFDSLVIVIGTLSQEIRNKINNDIAYRALRKFFWHCHRQQNRKCKLDVVFGSVMNIPFSEPVNHINGYLNQTLAHFIDSTILLETNHDIHFEMNFYIFIHILMDHLILTVIVNAMFPETTSFSCLIRPDDVDQSGFGKPPPPTLVSTITQSSSAFRSDASKMSLNARVCAR